MNIPKDPRPKLTPQMSYYDKLGTNWHPYIMFFHKGNFTSPVLNTDKFGFRFTVNNQNKFSPGSSFNKTDKNISFIVGSSSAFGVGASKDNKTISSLLTKKTNEKYLNFGCRAHVSAQELILFNQFSSNFHEIKNVIIFSGLNDLYLSFLKNEFQDFGPFFYGKQYLELMKNVDISKNRRILKFLLYPFYGDLIDYRKITIKELLEFDFNKFKNKKYNPKEIESFDIKYTISQLKRNLFVWKKLSEAYPFNLVFILQPTLNWISKPPSPEESRIIEYLDTRKDRMRVKQILTRKVYEEYTFQLSKLCNNLDIKFFDSNFGLNKYLQNDDWLFVDRVHMTDKGYNITSKFINEIIKNF